LSESTTTVTIAKKIANGLLGESNSITLVVLTGQVMFMEDGSWLQAFRILKNLSLSALNALEGGRVKPNT
jgi:hypothetical protein